MNSSVCRDLATDRDVSSINKHESKFSKQFQNDNSARENIIDALFFPFGFLKLISPNWLLPGDSPEY
jgi:hypothetical protein